jgi:predicted ATPase
MSLSKEEKKCLARAVAEAEASGTILRTAWRVLSGAPGSGKSALAGLIAKAGYRVMQDPGRAVLLKDAATGISSAKSRSDYRFFQQRVLEHALDAVSKTDPRRIVFFDYGVAESLAFLKGADLGWDDAFVGAAARIRFAKVFVLDPLNLCETPSHDPIRTEDWALRQKLHDLIVDVYEALGMSSVRVPVMALPDRLALVMRHI